MAFAVAMGVDFTLSAVTMAAALLPVEEKPIARIGIGSTALDAKEDARTNGITPNLYLYDVRGNMFAKQVNGDRIEDGVNEKKEFNILEGAERTAAPEYLLIQARTNDATCVSYITVTGAAGDERTWHAGYLKKCADAGKANFFYPSPNTIPSTDFRPGCVWLSNDDRFLQGISVHLPSFGFPETPKAEAAGKQFDKFTDTLCQAPGRMALYKTLDNDYIDCLPYYDKVLEKFTDAEDDEEKGNIKGFDKDMQRVVDGHVLPDKTITISRKKNNPTLPSNKFTVKCDYSKHKLFNQEMQPGKGPKTDTPQAQKQKEKDDAEAKKKAEEERVRKEAEDALNEAGRNPNGPPAGQGSFGGVMGAIPIAQAGQPVPVNETVANLDELKKNPPPPPPPAPAPSTADPAAPTGTPTPGEPSIEIRRSKRHLQQHEDDHESTSNMLARREQLRVAGDPCVDQLVVSHFPDHSAREVCEMHNSWGPDFVSIVEGLYCDMCERELYPICAHAHQQDCFDVETTVLRGKESLWQRVKKYIDVKVWGYGY